MGLSEEERTKLVAMFQQHVKESYQWWGGQWIEHPGLADWHVNQYVRKLELESSSMWSIQL